MERGMAASILGEMGGSAIPAIPVLESMAQTAQYQDLCEECEKALHKLQGQIR